MCVGSGEEGGGGGLALVCFNIILDLLFCLIISDHSILSLFIPVFAFASICMYVCLCISLPHRLYVSSSYLCVTHAFVFDPYEYLMELCNELCSSFLRLVLI